jgi:hypothetical protein
MKANNEQETHGKTRRPVRNVAAIAIVAAFLLTAIAPQASADLMVSCTLVDDTFNPIVGTDVTITNLDTSDSTLVTTDGSGDCSTSAGSINLQTGQIVGFVAVGSTTLQGCGLTFAQKLDLKFTGSNQVVLVVPAVAQSAATNLGLGKTYAERVANGLITTQHGLGFGRLQGDGSPWGNFNVHADFELVDRDANLAGIPSDRQYNFRLTVSYLGYYDSSCAYHAVANVQPDPVESTHASFDNSNVVYHSGVTQLTFNPALDADKVGQGATDKLMKIEIEARIFECDNIALWVNCNGGGPLDFTVTNDFYVEP